MFKNFFSLHYYSGARGIVVGIATIAVDIYKSESIRMSFLKDAELSQDEKDLSVKLQEKLVQFNQGDSTNIPQIKCTTSKSVDIAMYHMPSNSIIININQLSSNPSDVNTNIKTVDDFVLAHEFAHWKLNHCTGFAKSNGYDMLKFKSMDTWFRTGAFMLFGTMPIATTITCITGIGLLLLPDIANQGTRLINPNLIEDEADKYACKLGYAKNGYEFFKGHLDNIYDYDHPLISLRRAQCYMLWKEPIINNINLSGIAAFKDTSKTDTKK